MTVFEAYQQAIEENDDPTEREQVSSGHEIKTLIAGEILGAMKEVRDAKAQGGTAIDTISPLFRCVAFWFVVGIRVGKILRDSEMRGTQ